MVQTIGRPVLRRLAELQEAMQRRLPFGGTLPREDRRRVLYTQLDRQDDRLGPDGQT